MIRQAALAMAFVAGAGAAVAQQIGTVAGTVAGTPQDQLVLPPQLQALADDIARQFAARQAALNAEAPSGGVAPTGPITETPLPDASEALPDDTAALIGRLSAMIPPADGAGDAAPPPAVPPTVPPSSLTLDPQVVAPAPQPPETAALPAPAPAPVTAAAIESATFTGADLPQGMSPLTAKVQILLDRAAISPGIVDGVAGGMSRTAIASLERRQGLPEDGMLTPAVWAALGGDTAAGLMIDYTVTAADLAQVTGPVPEDYAAKAAMPLLGYATPREALAEKFHMGEGLLAALNPGATFAAGTTISVVAPHRRITGTVAAIVIDKTSRRLFALDQSGAILANYPVAVGSTDTPSPAGTYKVEGVALDPTYTYNPKVNFQQGSNDRVLTIPPGPNGPVGSVWIDLSKPTYGIHGTPAPGSLFTAHSHGCVRMTNWDATELAGMVRPGVTVVFTE